jgi:hypothetical protein
MDFPDPNLRIAFGSGFSLAELTGRIFQSSGTGHTDRSGATDNTLHREPSAHAIG